MTGIASVLTQLATWTGAWTSYPLVGGFFSAICAYSSGYLDWGLKITDDLGFVVFNNPHYLSNDSWGFNDPEDEDSDERISWTDLEWEKALEEQADNLIEGVQE